MEGLVEVRHSSLPGRKRRALTRYCEMVWNAGCEAEPITRVLADGSGGVRPLATLLEEAWAGRVARCVQALREARGEVRWEQVSQVGAKEVGEARSQLKKYGFGSRAVVVLSNPRLLHYGQYEQRTLYELERVDETSARIGDDLRAEFIWPEDLVAVLGIRPGGMVDHPQAALRLRIGQDLTIIPNADADEFYMTERYVAEVGRPELAYAFQVVK